MKKLNMVKIDMKSILRHLIIFLSLSSIILGQSRVITIDSAIQTALKNNREIQVSKLEIEKANAAVSEAFGYALPTVDVTAGFTRFLKLPKISFPDFGAITKNSTYDVLFDENVIPRDNSKKLKVSSILQSFSLKNNYEVKAQVTQILFNSAVFRGIGASEIFLNLAKENFKNTISKTVLDVKKTFYGAMLAKDLLEIAKTRFINARDHLKNIKALKNQGLVSEFNQMQAEVQVENIRPQIIQLENIFKDAKNGLKMLLNINQEEEIKLKGKMKYAGEIFAPETELISEAISSNLDLSSLKIKNQLDDEYSAIDRGSYWPTISAFGNYSFAGSANDFKFQNYQSSTVGLNFSMNLFQGGRTKNKVQQDQIVSMQTKEQIKSLTDLTISSVKSTLNDLKRVQSQIEAMKSNIKLAERAYQIAEDRYKEGAGSELEVKDANVALSQAKVNYTNSVHDYVIAKAELENLIGRLNKKYYKNYSDYLNK